MPREVVVDVDITHRVDEVNTVHPFLVVECDPYHFHFFLPMQAQSKRGRAGRTASHAGPQFTLIVAVQVHRATVAR